MPQGSTSAVLPASDAPSVPVLRCARAPPGLAAAEDHGGWVSGVLVAAVFLGMLVVIQHTQARQQAGTQRTLDEILHALPEADDALVRLEHGSDAELRAAADAHREVREAARSVPAPEPARAGMRPGPVTGSGFRR